MPPAPGRRGAGYVAEGYVVGVGPAREGPDTLRAVAVDDEQAGAAGGDGDVGGGLRRPPRADRRLIGGGVLDAVGGEAAEGRLAARGAGKDGPTACRVCKGGVEEGVIAGGGYGRPSFRNPAAKKAIQNSYCRRKIRS